MPFDGSELIATPFRTGAIQPGVWGLLQRAISRMRPGARALPLEFPAAFPTDTPGLVTSQVLRLARTLIEDERQWIQRRYETLDGRRCAVGALRSAGRLLALRSLNKEAHNLLLEVAVGRGFTDIERMNDYSTHGQVVSAFGAAIARAETRL